MLAGFDNSDQTTITLAKEISRGHGELPMVRPDEIRPLMAENFRFGGPQPALDQGALLRRVTHPTLLPGQELVIVVSRAAPPLAVQGSAGLFAGLGGSFQSNLTSAFLSRLNAAGMTKARSHEVADEFAKANGIGTRADYHLQAGNRVQGFDPSTVGRSAIRMGLDSADTDTSSLTDKQRADRARALAFMKQTGLMAR